MNIRKAIPEDARFIAICVMEAVGNPIMEQTSLSEKDKDTMSHVTSTCQREDTLYSWTNALIAEVDGKPVGCLVAYDGEHYIERRTITFADVIDIITFDINTMDNEAVPGEYYLDSLAIIPEWRGKGIGRTLLQKGIEEARSLGLLPVLACDPDNTNAKCLYESLGFSEHGHLFIFGEDYLRMTIE